MQCIMFMRRMKRNMCYLILMMSLGKLTSVQMHHMFYRKIMQGLDTLNPVLTIDGKLKLIGKYEETIGTCLVFTEEAAPVVHEETGPSEANLFSGKCIVNPNEAPAKQVKPMASLQKILKFRLFSEEKVQDAAAKPAN